MTIKNISTRDGSVTLEWNWQVRTLLDLKLSSGSDWPYHRWYNVVIFSDFLGAKIRKYWDPGKSNISSLERITILWNWYFRLISAQLLLQSHSSGGKKTHCDICNESVSWDHYMRPITSNWVLSRRTNFWEIAQNRQKSHCWSFFWFCPK
jgi:hypothetical protein